MALSVDKSALRKYIERSLQDLPPLPPVVAKILELTERPDSTASELDRLISSDPAMTAKILRVVNSAYYGLSNQVGTTTHAIVILGFRQIQNLVLSMAAMSLVKSRSPHMASTQMRFWKHSYGATEIRAEYWWGTQTASAGTSETPAALLLEPYYVRKFNGAFFYLLQNMRFKPLVAYL